MEGNNISITISTLRKQYFQLCYVEHTAEMEYNAAFKGDNREVEDAKRDAWLMARAKKKGFIEIIVNLGLYNVVFPDS